MTDLAEAAVVYAYPLYEMCRMRADTSPRRLPDGDTLPPPQRWCNVFTHSRQLLGPGKSRVVTPNNDTLYATAWLDLADEPLVIDVPDTFGRYYVLGLLDFYTNPFAHLGQRLTGTAARSFLITPPGWAGEVPAAFRSPGSHVKAPTRWVWIIGRILAEGEAALPAARAVQDGMALRTLSHWQAGRPGTPKVFDPQCDPRAPLSAVHFAQQVNAALRDHPPPEDDPQVTAALAHVGLGPGLPLPDARQLALLETALATAIERLGGLQTGGRSSTGWLQMPVLSGSFGDDHDFRALVALKYIGMLEGREATYSLAVNDAQGHPLNGRHACAMRFAPDELPQVAGFWSATMYDSADCMLVANPIDRYAIGDRTPGIAYDADGGLTIHLQHTEPDDPAQRANWLPAPADDFYLCLRFYLPSEALVQGRAPLPAITRTSTATRLQSIG